MNKKKMFVVSDVHGCATKLKDELKRAGYDKNNQEHIFVCCGDLFDRGDENLEVLRFVESIDQKVLIRGNHEDMLLKILETGHMAEHNFYNGTLNTMEEFFGRYAVDKDTGDVDFSGMTSMVKRVSDFIMSMQDYHETEDFVFVHGWLPSYEYNGKHTIMANWRKASPEQWRVARTLPWFKMYDGRRPLDDRKIVCGHYPTVIANKGNPGIFYGNGLVAIDGGAAMGNRVNVFVTE